MVALSAVARKKPNTVIPETLRFCIHFIKQKPSAVLRGSLSDAWQFPTLAWGGPTLPSALRRFTS
ncbi:hypothetical protein, partial [Cronobacter sakazakii]|uniref:hypothetical protein n=1 Tax=Cronobacter sakazakii TaxID=28141 RepID=UPI001C13009D